MSKNDLRAKHTPGPWEYHGQLSGSENHHGYRVRGKYVVAHVFPLDENGTEGLANARLIAAAPELLRVLQRVVDFSIFCDVKLFYRNPARQRVVHELDQMARAAIAKAEGNDA